MIKDFSTNCVLTDKYSQAFLNYRYESTDSAYVPIRFRVECLNASQGDLYINGLDLATLQNDPSYYIIPDSFQYYPPLDSAVSTTGATTSSFNIFTSLKTNKEFNVKIYAYDNTDASRSSYDSDVSIYVRPSMYTSVNGYAVSSVLTDELSSHLVLRTNPRFTGNIKLTVDTSENLYLDTFPVSQALNNKKYRKQPVSASSVLSSDIRNTFSSLPLGEIYKIDIDNTLDIATPKTSYNDQYELQYSYGCRLFEDDLYDESYICLAPLYINKNLPDYFAIFRVNGNYNPETYNTNPNLTTLFNDYIKNSTLVKAWSLKQNSNIGKYLRTHINEINDTTYKSPVFLSLSETDPNTWTGISLDKGIISGRSEIPYLFNQINNFSDLNYFVSQGFERQNQLMSNLINLQFAFDDHDVSLYSMNRYFGLYLTENVLYNIAYYAETEDSDATILSLDGRDSSAFINSTIFDSSGNISSTYEDRIFELNGILFESKRFNNKFQIDASDKTFISEFLNRPYENILSTKVKEKTLDPFITFTINNLLYQGEHFRIINVTQNKIWEVYSIDSSLMSAGESWPYCSQTEEDGYPIIARVPFSVDGSINNQIQAIQNAFNKFQDYEEVPFTVGIRTEDTLSLFLDASITDQFKFQFIRSNIRLNVSDASSPFNTSGDADDITLFGRYTPTADEYQIIDKDASFGPIDFKFFGDRKTIFVDFIYQGSKYIYSYDSSLSSLIQDYTLYKSTDNWYNLIKPFDISTQSLINSYLYVKDPVSLTNNDIIITDNEIQTVNNIWNAYSVYPVNISLMGINSIKDFDFTVYDEPSLGYTSEYWYARENDSSTWFINLNYGDSKYIEEKNVYIVNEGTGIIYINDTSIDYVPNTQFNTFDGSAFISISTPTIITYFNLDGSSLFNSYVDGKSEELISSYYSTNKILKYSLTVPTICKWIGLGSDCRNNEFRLILDSSIFKESELQGFPTTNYIPYTDSSITVYEQEISYPSYKYLTPGERNWEDYIYYDVNDIIDCSVSCSSFKDLMFSQPYVDIFSKLVYSNSSEVEGIKNRSSICYYNGYNQTLETLFLGLRYSFSITSTFKSLFNLSNYNKYRFSFISSSSRNTNGNYPIEVIINENTQTILMIWYQGNDVLNYSYRNSTTLPGHNLLFGSGIFESLGYSDSSMYSYVKPPFIVNGKTSIVISYSTNDSAVSYNDSVCTPFAQLNYNKVTYLGSVFNAPGLNFVSNNVMTYSYQFNTYTGINNYVYHPNNGTYGNNVSNWSSQYYSNINNYSTNTTKLDTLKYLLGVNFVMYSIIRGTTVYDNVKLQSQPITISILDPRDYQSTDGYGIKTYNGWYKPKFNNIVNFSSNDESELMNVVKKDFTLSNTKIKGYNFIPQLWYNKVVDSVTEYDVSIGNAIGIVDSFNPMLSQWDKNYYNLFTDSNYNSYYGTSVNGYLASAELPAFFGSKLVSLPTYLDVVEWNNGVSNATYIENDYQIEVTFDLTNAITNIFNNNFEFISNWNDFSLYGANISQLINNYIQTTILNYYDIRTSRIQPTIYYKTYDGTRLYNVYDSSFTNTNTNINGNIYTLDNKYMYKIIFNKVPNYSYYVKFRINQK